MTQFTEKGAQFICSAQCHETLYLLKGKLATTPVLIISGSDGHFMVFYRCVPDGTWRHVDAETEICSYIHISFGVTSGTTRLTISS